MPATKTAMNSAIERLTSALVSMEAHSPETSVTLVELRDHARLPHTSPAGSWAAVLVAMRSRGLVGSQFKRDGDTPIGWGWYLR